jgi:molybdopterin-guanine dinucleotide biosynthesis adapter protein
MDGRAKTKMGWIMAKVLQIIGYKNTGKTTMLCKLAERLSEKGYKIGAIKNDAHHFQIDHPGKDTWQFREAGAHAVAITSNEQTAYLEEGRRSLDELISRMEQLDYVLVEGFKTEAYPKLVMIQSEEQIGLIEASERVWAVAVWDNVKVGERFVPVFHMNDIEGIFMHLMTSLQ